VGLEHVQDPVVPRAHRKREHDEVAAEMDVDDVEPSSVAVEPSLQSGRTDTGEPRPGNYGSDGEQLDRYVVQAGRYDREPPGAGAERHLVAPADQLHTLIERDPGGSPVRAVGVEQRDHLQDAHGVNPV
jgi:hypothetical protein